MNSIVMNRYIAIFLVLLSMGWFSSCNDEFLEENSIDGYNYSDTLYLSNNAGAVNLILPLQQAGNASYKIEVCPKWMNFSAMKGKFDNGITNLSFETLDLSPGAESWLYEGALILNVDGLGLVRIVVMYGSGSQGNLFCRTQVLDLNSSAPHTLFLENRGEGALNWKVSDIPHWLSLTPTAGVLQSGEEIGIEVTALLEGLEEGDYSQMLRIESDVSSQALFVEIRMTVKEYSNPENVQALQGEVVDVEFSKATGYMVVAVKDPDELLVFDTRGDKKHIMMLDYTPNCVGFSADGTQLVIGHTVARVSHIDLTELTLLKTYDVGCIPYDIVLGDNSWCYITPTEDQHVEFRNLNLEDGTVVKGRDWGIYEQTVIRKPIGQSFLVASCMATSPNGIDLFDLSGGSITGNEIHMHESTGNFWLSETGDKIYCGNKRVYKTPETEGNWGRSIDYDLYGVLENDSYNLAWIDHCSGSAKVFAVTGNLSYWNSDGFSNKVFQYNDDSFKLENTYELSNYALNVDGMMREYEVEARYVFSNKEGARLYVVKKVSAEEVENGWSLETIDLE